MSNSTSITLRGEGMDSFWNALNDYRVRSIRIDDEDYFSLVDLMRTFGGGTSNPRRYWGDHKKALLDNDAELYEKIVQLKARSDDGKFYRTDFAPRWVCLYIVLGMHTSSANQLRKHAAKIFDGMSKAALKYRSMNVSQGMEWAADTIHAQLSDAEPPDVLSPFEDIGYTPLT